VGPRACTDIDKFDIHRSAGLRKRRFDHGARMHWIECRS
jgi:hypothetical protein